MSQFRNLAIRGGGVKGTAYVGALAELDRRGVLSDIENVAGTSAGAIAAALLALRATTDQLRVSIAGAPFSRFLDSTGGLLGPLIDVVELKEEFGICSGDVFVEWFRAQMRAVAGRDDVTFAELAPPTFRRLSVVATNLSGGTAKVFSAESTPTTPVVKAVRASMSIPIIFEAVRIDGEVLVDGGLVWNFPIDLYDRDENGARTYNKETLGLAVQPSRVGPAKIDGLVPYGCALINLVVEAANAAHLQPQDWQRTISIPVPDGVSALSFDLTPEQLFELEANGVGAVQDYFAWFDDPAQRPLNRKVS